MSKAIDLISKAMTEMEIEHDKVDENRIVTGCKLENGTIVTVVFNAHNDENDITVHIWGIVNVKDKEKIAPMCLVLNALNDKFRYAKFTIDEELDVNCQYDVPAETNDDCIGKVCGEVFIRLTSIVNEAYPELMSAI